MPTYAPQPSPTQTPIQAADPFALFGEAFTPKRAVSYVRVSTREQAERGGREEGFSIPAQRDANKKKATSLGAMVVKEFVERGVSGTSTNRPALQQMLRYLEEEGDNIDFIIVHKFDRLARNRADEVTLSTKFVEQGIRLVSTSENIDQTPGGMLLQGIMSSIAEFYSRNLANEVVKGLSEKARSGGTVGRAPIGYLNTRDFSTRQEIRTVELDPKRSSLVAWAFEQYATGEHSVRTLTAELVKRGLTTVPTLKMSEKPVQIRHIHSMLTNIYYTGITTFKGIEYPGSHTPLVSNETFETVQTILRQKMNGERTRDHPHYLKSTLFCGHCGYRMMVQLAKSRSGDEYSYFSCLGRHSKRTVCTLRSIQIDHVELLIDQLYQRIHLSQDFRDNLERLLREALKELHIDTDTERAQLENTKQSIERRRNKLLEAHYNDAIPLDMLRTEQKRLEAELAATNRTLQSINASLDETERLITLALDIAQHAANTYRQAPDHIKRLLNQVLFEKLLVTVGDNDEHQLDAVLAPPFDLIYGPATRAHVDQVSGSTTATQGSEQKGKRALLTYPWVKPGPGGPAYVRRGKAWRARSTRQVT